MKSLKDYSGVSKKDFKDKKALDIDICNSLLDERAANCCIGLMKEEKKNHNYANILRGVCAYTKISIGTRLGKYFGDEVKAENNGLRCCIKVLNKAKVKENRIYKACKEHSQKHISEGAEELIETCKDHGMQIHFSTLAGDQFIRYLSDEFDATYTTHKILCKNSVPYDVDFRIYSAMEKLTETRSDLEKMGISMKETIYIGDSYADRFFFESNDPAGISICSPHTTSKEIRKMAKIKLDSEYNFRWLSEELR